MDLMNALELEKDLVGLCFATEDKEIGMEAFLSKQKPAFRWFIINVPKFLLFHGMKLFIIVSCHI